MAHQQGNEAEKFLKEILAEGPVLQKEIKTAAEAPCLAWATVRRAKSSLGIKAYKDGMEGGWLWDLPKMFNGIGEDAHLKRVSTFGSDEHLRGNGVAGSPSLNTTTDLEIPKFLAVERG